jgi:hypothetical protein
VQVMKILRIIGAATDDQRTALHEAMAIWSQGGTCSPALLHRFPSGRVEIHVVSNADDEKGAIIVIDEGILGFYPLDETDEATVH